MSEGVETHEECLQSAKKKGLGVRYPAPNELFVDLDTQAAIDTFERAAAILARSEKGMRWERHPSPSREPGHAHVVVTLQRKVGAKERILLQACLGSDPLRELLSLQRFEAGNPHPTLFFERPEDLGQKTTDEWMRMYPGDDQQKKINDGMKSLHEALADSAEGFGYSPPDPFDP